MQQAANVPILLYHDLQPDGWADGLGDPFLRPYILPISEFERQMDYLVTQGYQGISVARFLRLREKDPAALARTVVLVFDDGWNGQSRFALPILKRAGFSATFFIIAGRIGQEGYMDLDTLKNLKNQGIEVGSHTMTHPYPTELSEEELYKELEVSKAVLEDGLRQEVVALSSPTGFFDPRMAPLARRAGYRNLCISRVGLNNPNADPFALKKIGIKRGQSFKTFVGIVHREQATLASMRSAQVIRDISKKLLRRRTYERLKAVLLRPQSSFRATSQ